MPKASAGALRLLRTCAGVRPSENVLIVTDTNTNLRVALTVMNAAMRLSRGVAVVIMNPRRLPGDEPPAHVVDAMLASDVIICVTSTTLFHTNAKKAACRKGARLISMTGATLPVLASKAMFADFKTQANTARRLASLLGRASHVRVTNPAGTELELTVQGRKGHAITGICRRRGEAQGVPDIEAYIAPLENGTNGTLVVDGSTSVTGLVQQPITMDIQGGRARRIRGSSQAKRLLAILQRTKNNAAFRVGELGIGLNPLARVRGAIIEDEAALGTAHVALGDNIGFGGKNKAPIHVDLVFRGPHIEFDGKVVLSGKRLLI